MAKHGNRTGKSGIPTSRESVRGTGGSARPERLPSDLHLGSRSSFADLAPGDVVFLDDFAQLRESFSPQFVAVLACPSCGAPGLITCMQYSGGAPIVCTSKLCSGVFRILEESQIVALPPC